MAVSNKLSMAAGRIEQAYLNAEERNKAKRELESKILNLQTAKDEALFVYNIVVKSEKRLALKAAQFREQRKEELTSEIKGALDLIFPEEDFQVMIHWDSRGKKPLAKILIGIKDSKGEIGWCAPRNVNGEFVKQLISFTTLSSISAMLGATFFCADESLNSGDNISLESSEGLIKRLLRIFQMFIIEHKEAFYQNIPRREFHLNKIRGANRSKFSGYVEILDVVDVDTEGNEEHIKLGDGLDNGLIAELQSKDEIQFEN